MAICNLSSKTRSLHLNLAYERSPSNESLSQVVVIGAVSAVGCGSVAGCPLGIPRQEDRLSRVGDALVPTEGA
eukprot:1317627-Amorphochlora_amoeboformis.AAC.1